MRLDPINKQKSDEMQSGDKFIRYSKDGSVIRGIVSKAWTKYSIDIKNGVVIKKRMITTDRGFVFDANECYVVDREISINFIKKVRALFKKGSNTFPDPNR